MNLDLPTRQTICALVSGIVTTDKKLDAREAAFVYRLMKAFGVEASHPNDLAPIANPERAAQQLQELPREAQDDTLRILVDAACVDGKIAPEERVFLRAIAAVLRISDEDLKRRVDARLMETVIGDV